METSDKDKVIYQVLESKCCVLYYEKEDFNRTNYMVSYMSLHQKNLWQPCFRQIKIWQIIFLHFQSILQRILQLDVNPSIVCILSSQMHYTFSAPAEIQTATFTDEFVGCLSSTIFTHKSSVNIK